MSVGVTLVGLLVFATFGFVVLGGPMLLVNWFRERRRQEIGRQIALTDAIDAQIGPMVAPVVTKPFLGPWEVRIATPAQESITVARILSVVDAVFSDFEGAGASGYRISLTARADSSRKSRASRSRTHRSATRWVRNPVGAPNTPGASGIRLGC